MPVSKSHLLFILSAIGLIVLPHVKHIPASVFGFFYVLLGWRFIAVWQTRWLPNRAVVLVLSIAGIAILYRQNLGILGQDAGTNLFITALGLKLFEIKAQRDLYLIVFLAFIVASSQFLYEQNVLMAVYILLVCTLLLATLVTVNSYRTQTRQALKTAATLILQALPMAIVLFILFPRLEAPQWLVLEEDHKALSGLSEVLEPGSITNLGLSDQLVFRAKFTGNIPPPAERYWRGPVLYYTDGKHWSQPDAQRLQKPPQLTGEPYRYTLLMEPQSKNWVFGLDMPGTVQSPLMQQANYQLITGDNPEKRSEYHLIAYPNYNTGELGEPLQQETLRLPGEPAHRIRELVEQLHGFDGPPQAFIDRLLNYFRQEEFHYTLTPPLIEHNPIETFLFETRHGFCSHYAAAFTYLMRVAHIPARIVTGYQGGELNAVGSFLEIRQANAHAWAEVWLQGQGWVRVDPTAAIAPERIEHGINIDQQAVSGALSFAAQTVRPGTALSWLKHARQTWDNLDYNWQRWVINYDNSNQSQLLSSLGINDIKTLVYWLLTSIGSFTALLSLFLLRKTRSQPDPSRLLYQRFCRKIARHGLTRHPSEGALAFAGRINSLLPARAAEVNRITHLYLKLRYGQHARKTDFEQLRKSVSKFKA
ncbi:MAG: transglutaminase [Methylobacter sp.]|nr:MAG: transglutaminase [Methylobacter sp.]PPD22003.1 MAG: transglutaminase [Methylobacter sp.]